MRAGNFYRSHLSKYQHHRLSHGWHSIGWELQGRKANKAQGAERISVTSREKPRVNQQSTDAFCLWKLASKEDQSQVFGRVGSEK